MYDTMSMLKIHDYQGNKKNIVDESNLEYSTSEVDTGKKWIDGKPIYRKVVSINYGQYIPLESEKEITLSSDITTGVERFISVNLIVNDDGRPVNYYKNSVFITKIDGNKITLYNMLTSMNIVFKDSYICVEYTKA